MQSIKVSKNYNKLLMISILQCIHTRKLLLYFPLIQLNPIIVVLFLYYQINNINFLFRFQTVLNFNQLLLYIILHIHLLILLIIEVTIKIINI